MKKTIIIILILLITTTAFAGQRFFRARQSDIMAWLAAKSYTGTYYDMLMGYFSTENSELETSLSAGTLTDYISHVLGVRGYTGTVRDRLAGFFATRTGVGHPSDAERAFWAGSSDFSVTWGDMEKYAWSRWNGLVWGDLD